MGRLGGTGPRGAGEGRGRRGGAGLLGAGAEGEGEGLLGAAVVMAGACGGLGGAVVSRGRSGDRAALSHH